MILLRFRVALFSRRIFHLLSHAGHRNCLVGGIVCSKNRCLWLRLATLCAWCLSSQSVLAEFHEFIPLRLWHTYFFSNFFIFTNTMSSFLKYKAVTWAAAVIYSQAGCDGPHGLKWSGPIMRGSICALLRHFSAHPMIEPNRINIFSLLQDARGP